MVTSRINPITTAAAAKEAAAKAAQAQQEAAKLQAAADAANLQVKEITTAAYREYYESVLETHAAQSAKIANATKEAESAFREAVLTGSESGAAWIKLMEARSARYALDQERIRALEKTQGGRDVKDRTVFPSDNRNFSYADEVNKILSDRAREIAFDAMHEIDDRRDSFVAKRVESHTQG